MSPFSIALTVCQLSLAVVLVTAAATKVLSSEDYLAALRLSKVPKAAVLPLGALVVALELALSLLLLQGSRTLLLAGFSLCTGTLALFALWAVWMNGRGLKVRCGCFGDSETTIGPTLILRNLALVALALFGLTMATKFASLLPKPSAEGLIAASTLGMVYALGIAFLRARTALVYSFRQLLEADTREEGAA